MIPRFLPIWKRTESKMRRKKTFINKNMHPSRSFFLKFLRFWKSALNEYLLGTYQNATEWQAEQKIVFMKNSLQSTRKNISWLKIIRLECCLSASREKVLGITLWACSMKRFLEYLVSIKARKPIEIGFLRTMLWKYENKYFQNVDALHFGVPVNPNALQSANLMTRRDFQLKTLKKQNHVKLKELGAEAPLTHDVEKTLHWRIIIKPVLLQMLHKWVFNGKTLFSDLIAHPPLNNPLPRKFVLHLSSWILRRPA